MIPLRGDAEREVAGIADAYATGTRTDADAYSSKVREAADTDAERKQVVGRAQRATAGPRR